MVFALTKGNHSLATEVKAAGWNNFDPSNLENSNVVVPESFPTFDALSVENIQALKDLSNAVKIDHSKLSTSQDPDIGLNILSLFQGSTYVTKILKQEDRANGIPAQFRVALVHNSECQTNFRDAEFTQLYKNSLVETMDHPPDLEQLIQSLEPGVPTVGLPATMGFNTAMNMNLLAIEYPLVVPVSLTELQKTTASAPTSLQSIRMEASRGTSTVIAPINPKFREQIGFLNKDGSIGGIKYGTYDYNLDDAVELFEKILGVPPTVSAKHES